MMYTLNKWCAIVTFFLFVLCRGDPLGRERRLQHRYSDSTMPPFPRHLALPWEFALREIILNASAPHKRPLDASFYGGPLATYSNNDTNVVLSRGNMYRLLNGHWMLCQDGCLDCDPCMLQRDPLFKWTLQRIERSLNADHPRHELQLTITPQTDHRLHASDFWPNSYVYVMSQGQREASTMSVGTPLRDDGLFNREDSTPSSLEDSFSAQHHRSRNPWRLAERDSSASRDDNRVTTHESMSSTEKSVKKESPEQKQRTGNVKPWYRPRPRSTGNPGEETNRLAPKLILGIDPRGQKHLVHVVPIDHPPAAIANIHVANHLIPSQFMVNQTMQLNDTTAPKRERQNYQRIFRRVFDSLNTHRRSIEDFLEADKSMGRHHRTMPPAMDGMDFSEFTWNNRAINHTVANFIPLRRGRGDMVLSPFYVENDEGKIAESQQYRGQYGDTKRNGKDYYTSYRDMNHAEISRNQSPMNFNWDEERRKLGIKPYYINTRGISGINSSISSSRNFLMNVNPSGFSNGVANSTLIDKANNNSVESVLVTTKRGNGQLFRPEWLKSDDANREFEASHHPFRIIVTTESPVIRMEHETLNDTKTLEITTLKAFVDAS